MERIDKNFERINQTGKAHGERLGEVEKQAQQIPVNKAQIDKMEGGIDKLTDMVNALQVAPAEKWKEIVKYAIIAVVSAAVAYFLGSGCYY